MAGDVVPIRRPRHRRVLAYARVSSAEQALGTSLQDQQNAIASYVTGLGLSVATFYVEAESGVHEKAERRLEIQRLLRDVREGDLVLCDKLDRWSRDPEFIHGSTRRILEAGASFYAVAEHIDPSTAEGKFSLGMRGVFAAEEHNRIKVRLVGTRKLLRNAGYYVEGLPPYGYRRKANAATRLEKNILVVQESAAAVVRAAFALAIAGHSLSQVAQATGLSRDRVHDLLRNRVLLGQVRNTAGEWVKGMHPAIVDALVFQQTQEAIDARRLGSRPQGTPAETSTWTLRDIATCAACKGRMGAAYAGPHGARRYYYRCVHKCTRSYVPVREVEAAAEPLVVARLEELRALLAAEPVGRPVTRLGADVATRRAKLASMRDVYVDQNAEGIITRETLLAKLAKLDAQGLKLDALEHARRTSPLDDPKTRRAALREVGAIAKAWGLATPEERRRIVGHLATAAALTKGEAPRFTWRSAEELAAPAQ